MSEKLGSAAHGIDLTILSGISEQDGQVVKGDNGLTQDGPYAVDAGIEGATQVEYQTLEAAGTDQFANNKRKRTTRPSQNPTATVTYLDIDWDVLNKVVGYEEDETGGATLDQDHKPHISLLTREPVLDGNFLYEAFANATARHMNQSQMFSSLRVVRRCLIRSGIQVLRSSMKLRCFKKYSLELPQKQ